MKQRTIFLLTIMLLVAGNLFAQERGIKPIKEVTGKPGTQIENYYYALIIGNNNYQDPGINSLDEPINDAVKLYNVLTTKYTFATENVILLKNATYVQMINAFDDLSNKLTGEDNLLVFYAGHGWWDEDKELGYWLPTDAKKNSTAFWIRNSTISDYMNSIKSKHTLLIADACFSGSIFKTRTAFDDDADPYVTSLYKLPSKTAMTSGNLKEVPDQSKFLYYLVKRLNENTEKYLPADELFVSFRKAVMNNSNTEPQFGTIQNAGDEGGEFIFIKRTSTQPDIDIEPDIDEEDIAPLVTYGNLHITNYLEGSLYIDEIYKKPANKNKLIKITDLETGTHTIKIKTDTETWTEQVTIYENQTATLTAKSNKPPPDPPPQGNKTAGTKFTNTKAGCTMVWAGGGTFQMGSNDSDAYDDEKPVHTVTVGNFALSQTEITNSQYCKFLNEKGNQTEGGATWLDIESSYCQIEKSGGIFKPKSGKGNYPVIEVTWYGAKAYCNWAGGRLPTEAEWKFAAKGRENYKYAGSNNIDDVAWYGSNSGSATHEVAQKQANAFGLYDMSGNVWEWVEDKWHSNYTDAPTNGSAWTSGSSSYRVYCGGSWYYGARFRLAFQFINGYLTFL